MKRKFIAVFTTVLLSASICSAQGIYKNSQEGEQTSTEAPLRAGKPGDPSHPGDTGADPAPIGSGLGVLVALSGAYMLVKKKKSSRK